MVEKTLINDIQNKVDLATFLEDGDILLKINNRFLLFKATNGQFVADIEFEPYELPCYHNKVINKSNLDTDGSPCQHTTDKNKDTTPGGKVDERLKQPDIF